MFRLLRTKIWLLGCLLMLSCGGSEKVPEGVYQEEEMVDILLDIYLAQAKVGQNRAIKRDSAEVLYKYYENYLLDKHGTDTTTFYNSLIYYFQEPDKFDRINEIVLDSLNLRLEKIEAQEEKDRRDRDNKD